MADLILGVNLFTAAVISANAWMGYRSHKRFAEHHLVMLRRIHELEIMNHSLERRITHLEKRD